MREKQENNEKVIFCVNIIFNKNNAIKTSRRFVVYVLC